MGRGALTAGAEAGIAVEWSGKLERTSLDQLLTLSTSEPIILTVTNDILKKLELVGYDLPEYSLDTVKLFYRDAVAAGFRL